MAFAAWQVQRMSQGLSLNVLTLHLTQPLVQLGPARSDSTDEVDPRSCSTVHVHGPWLISRPSRFKATKHGS